jgi:hypothetical protein
MKSPWHLERARADTGQGGRPGCYAGRALRLAVYRRHGPCKACPYGNYPCFDIAPPEWSAGAVALPRIGETRNRNINVRSYSRGSRRLGISRCGGP